MYNWLAEINSRPDCIRGYMIPTSVLYVVNDLISEFNIAIKDRGRELQHQFQLILSEIIRRQMNPLDDGGGGKDDILTARGDRPSIYTVEAPFKNTYHPQRGGSRRRSY